MISRVWHGWATPENADAYEALLRTKIFPGIERVEGYRGAFLLRRDDGDEVEFVTITRFDSIEAVKAFAGEEYETAVVLPEADALLSHHDARSAHFETVIEPD
jgi:antibiotic biosynthesis monooxygenase (ABM) superfamily enzyme